MNSPHPVRDRIFRLTMTAILAACAFHPAVANAGPEPAAVCVVSKQKAASAKLKHKVKCHGQAIKKNVAVDEACLAKAEEKFDTSFAKAEGKGSCNTSGDVGDIEAMVDGWLEELLAALPAPTSTTTTTMAAPVCGDGSLHPLEECDDGNDVGGDGCSEACELEATSTALRLTSLRLISPRIVVDVGGSCQDITNNNPVVFGSSVGDSVNNGYSKAIGPISSGGTYSLHMVALLSPLYPEAPATLLALHLDAACQEGEPLDSCGPDAEPTIFMQSAGNLAAGTCFTPVPADVNTRAGVPTVYTPTANTVAAPCFDSATGDLILRLYGLDVPLQDAHVSATYSGSPTDSLVGAVITGFLPQTVAADLLFPAEEPLVGGMSLYSVLQAGNRSVQNSLGANVPDGCNVGGATNEDDADTNGAVAGFWVFLNFTAELVTWTAPVP